MSNVYILETSFGYSPTNSVTQIKFLTDAYEWFLPKETKIVYNDTVFELPEAEIEHPERVNMKTYEGDDAIRQLKKMGIDPADDMDKPETNDIKKQK